MRVLHPVLPSTDQSGPGNSPGGSSWPDHLCSSDHHHSDQVKEEQVSDKVIPAVQVPPQLLHDLSSHNHDGVAEKETQVPHPALPHPDSGKESTEKPQESTSTFSDPLPCDWSDSGRGGEFGCSGVQIDNHIDRGLGDNDVVQHSDHDVVISWRS